MEVKLQPTTVSGTRVCYQLQVSDTVLYSLPHNRGFETDFIAALERHISEAGMHWSSYKNNVQGKRDARERWNALRDVKQAVEQMGNYKNVDGEICPDKRPW